MSWHHIAPGCLLPDPLEDVPVIVIFDEAPVRELAYRDASGIWRLTGKGSTCLVVAWFELPPLYPTPPGAAKAPAQPAVALNTGSRSPGPPSAPPQGDTAGSPTSRALYPRRAIRQLAQRVRREILQ